MASASTELGPLSYRAFFPFGSEAKLEYQGPPGYFFENAEIWAIGKVRLDNSKDLRARWSRPEASDLEVASEVFLRLREGCVDHLRGDFAFVIKTKSDGAIFAARDHFGVRPFFYHLTEKGLSFSNSLAQLVQSEHVPQKLCEEWQINFLNGIYSPADSTIWQHIKRLPPAHILPLKNQPSPPRRYWQLQCPPERKLSEDEAIYGLREELFRAVECRLPAKGKKLACELSGGIDSTAVAGIAAHLRSGQDIHCFSHVMRTEDLQNPNMRDERERILDFCKLHDLDPCLIDDEGQGLLDDLLRQCRILGTPPQVYTTLASLRLYERAAEPGCGVLFSGFGGDECVSMRSPGTFLNEFAQKKRWRALLREMRAKQPNLWPLSLARFILSYPFRSKERYFPQRNDPWYLLDERYRRHPSVGYASNKNSFDRTLSLLPNRLHTAERLEESVLSAEHFGLEYRYPLFDLQLIEYFLSLPVEFKLKTGLNRHLIRQALDGITPDSIRLGIKEPGSTVPSTRRRQQRARESKEIFFADIPYLDKKRCENFLSGNDLPRRAFTQYAYFLSAFHRSHEL